MPAELTLLHACAPASYGGLERVVGAVTAGLSRRGHRVAIAAVLDPGATVPSAISAAAGHGVEVLVAFDAADNSISTHGPLASEPSLRPVTPPVPVTELV
jgi:hypothetical protein